MITIGWLDENKMAQNIFLGGCMLNVSLVVVCVLGICTYILLKHGIGGIIDAILPW